MTQNIITDVPLKKKNKSAIFFSDRVEFNGICIFYDDIDVLMTNAQTTIHTYVFIPVARSFDGGARFKTKAGKTKSINMNCMTLFGIPLGGSPRKIEKLYPALFDAVFNIVAKYMAQKYINLIKAGEAVEVAGLIINASEAKTKAKNEKKVVVINKENYLECLITNDYGVAVYNKSSDMLWRSSVWSNKNTLLVPHILDDIFGSQ